MIGFDQASDHIDHLERMYNRDCYRPSLMDARITQNRSKIIVYERCAPILDDEKRCIDKIERVFLSVSLIFQIWEKYTLYRSIKINRIYIMF